MTPLPRSLSLAPTLPFKYVGGDAAVDLVNTVDWTSEGPREDRLTSYERLTRWAEGAALLAPRLGGHFRTLAEQHPGQAARAHREALELRWLLRRLFRAVSDGERTLSGPALAAFDDAVRASASHLRLTSTSAATDGPRLRWSWHEATTKLDSLVWPIVRSAAELLTSDDASRIRECAGEQCGWMYVDRSRNGLRRWCQMETCGTREKSRQRAKRAGERPSAS